MPILNLSISGSSFTKSTLQWTGIFTGATGDFVSHATGTGISLIVGSTASGNNSFVDTKLTPNTTYVFQISGNFQNSNTITGSTLAATFPIDNNPLVNVGTQLQTGFLLTGINLVDSNPVINITV